MQMFKLRQTWNEIFPAKKMYAIDLRVKGIDPAWPILAPKPSQKNIHLNPKFLDGKPTTPTAPVASRISAVPKPGTRQPSSIHPVPEEHTEVRQQLLAKQQELLKLQQQRIEIELLQAKLKLEEQMKETQKKPVNNFVPVSGSSSQVDSVTCTSFTSAVQNPGLQMQQHNTQQFQLLNSNTLTSSIASDPRINRVASRFPVRDPRIQKMVPGLIHPATILTRPVLPAILPTPSPVQTVPVQAPSTTSSRIVVPPTSKTAVSEPSPVVPKTSPKKTSVESVVEKPPVPKKSILDAKSIKVENEDRPLTKNATKSNKDSSSPMIIDLTADDDIPKKTSPLKTKIVKGKRNDQKDSLKKGAGSPDRKKKRATSPRPKRNEDTESYKARKERRSSRSKTRSRSRSPSRSPLRRNKKIEKKIVKSSPNKNSAAKKSSKSKKAQLKDIDKTGDVDLRQMPVIAVTGDVDHRLLSQDVQIIESDKEPPVKKQKIDDEIDSLFGKGDQDYRLPSLSVDESDRSRENDNEDRRRSRERQRNWAQYKADHPDEIKSPLKHRENSVESLNDRDFRIPKHSNYSEDYRRRGVDRLGRPLLSTRPKLDSRHEFFRNQQPDDKQIAVMLEKQDDILREAAEQMRSGVITTEDYDRVLDKFKKLSEQYELNRSRPNNEKNTIALPPSKPILIDGQKREIKFFGRKAIVIMDDNEPHEVTFTGVAKGVSIDGKEFFKLGFGGATKDFVVEGKTHSIQFGAPSREIYVNGVPYAAVFGGEAITVQIYGKSHQLRVGGPSPNVEISEEPISMSVLEEEVKKEAERRKAEEEREKADLSMTVSEDNMDLDLRKGFEQIKPQELGDVDMRVPPVAAPLDRVRSSPKEATSPRSSSSPNRPERPERTSRWEPVDRSVINRPIKPWDSPRRDTPGNSWNSPERSEWKNTSEPTGERRNLLDPVSKVRTNFTNFQGSEELGKNDSSVPVWNNPNQIPNQIGSGTSGWDWRLNQQPNNFQPGSPKCFDNFQSQMRPSLQAPNMPPYQPMPNMMANIMPNINQMPPNYRIPRLMGNNNFNYGMRSQQPNFMIDNPNFGAPFRGPSNVGTFNRGMGMQNNNFDSHFGSDGRNMSMQNVDNYQGGNMGDKRVPLLPHPPPGATPMMPQNPQSLLPPPPQAVEIPAPMDVSSLLAKLISTGLIKTDTNAATSSTSETGIANVGEILSVNANEIVLKEDQHIEAIPPIELSPESLKTRYSGVIDLLYRGTQCASCGMRFKDSQQDKYSQHLDWHFRANRREKDGAKKAFSRKWFYDVEDWYQFEETEDLDDRARSFFELQAGEEQFQTDNSPEEIPSVKASQDQSENNCVVCNEPFQMFWVEDLEEWHLKGAIRREGKTYHPLCYDDFIKAQAAEVAETPVDISDVNPLEISLEAAAKEEAVEKSEEETAKEDTDEKTEDIKAEKEEMPLVEEGPAEEKMQEVEESEDKKTEIAETVKEAKNEPVENKTEEIPVETKEPENLEPPFDEEIIGVISESEMPSDEEDNSESKPESKMVTLQPGGRPGKIVMKVKANSIINPIITPRPETPATTTGNNESTNEGDKMKANDKTDESEIEEFRPPSPDPRFENFAPVQRGKELSGLCSIM